MNQFRIRGYKIFRHDRNRFRGSLMLSVNKNISCRSLSDDPIFFCFGTWQLRLTSIYKPPSQSDNEFSNKLSLGIDHYLPKYENLILIGDFNLSTGNLQLDTT